MSIPFGNTRCIDKDGKKGSEKEIKRPRARREFKGTKTEMSRGSEVESRRNSRKIREKKQGGRDAHSKRVKRPPKAK